MASMDKKFQIFLQHTSGVNFATHFGRVKKYLGSTVVRKLKIFYP